MLLSMDDLSALRDESVELLTPSRLYSRTEVLERPGPVPASPGVYAWYFADSPLNVPTDTCHVTELGTLLYVGISPKAPPANGGAPSQQNLRNRVKYHFNGNAAGSTFRLTLGSLLAEQLGIELRRVGSGGRLTFGSGESALSEWMEQHARVCWTVHPRPWILESDLIQRISLPLNLDQNRHSGFHAELSAARAQQRARARQLPIAHG